MMPAPFSGDLRLRVIWFVHVLLHSVAEASFFLGGSKRKVERYISKFLVTGDGVHTRKRGTSFIKKSVSFFCLRSQEPSDKRSTLVYSFSRKVDAT